MTALSPIFRNHLRAGVCLAALSLWACNGSSTGTPGTGHGQLIDACTLVTKAEAEVIIGRPVLTVQMDTTKYITTCTYIADVTSGAILPTRLMVQGFTSAGVQGFQGAGSTMTAETYIAGLKTSVPAADWEAVAGVGSDAIWWTRAGKISFYKGDVVSEVVFSPLGKGVDTSATARAGAVAAAKVGAERI